MGKSVAIGVIPSVVLLAFTCIRALGAQSPPSTNAVPRAIHWPNQPNNQVGLLYSPELLADRARSASGPVSSRILRAIREQTPIVVMWTIPGPSVEQLQRPFATVIVDDGPGGGDSWSALRTEPLWVAQEAEDLRQIDPDTPFKDVGVMAAYPKSAFVAGRLVTIYASLPCYPDRPCERGHHRGAQVFGRIE